MQSEEVPGPEHGDQDVPEPQGPDPLQNGWGMAPQSTPLTDEILGEVTNMAGDYVIETEAGLGVVFSAESLADAGAQFVSYCQASGSNATSPLIKLQVMTESGFTDLLTLMREKLPEGEPIQFLNSVGAEAGEHTGRKYIVRWEARGEHAFYAEDDDRAMEIISSLLDPAAHQPLPPSFVPDIVTGMLIPAEEIVHQHFVFGVAEKDDPLAFYEEEDDDDEEGEEE